MSQDPYVDPDTGVLLNELGISDADQLARAEATITQARAAAMLADGVPGRYDLAHLQELHRQLFEGIYAWAGELRTVPIAKADLFCLPQHLQRYGAEVFGELAGDRHLQGLGRDQLVDRLAHHLGNVNALHPFREGNGRTQRLFFDQLTRGLGYQLRWDQATREENNQTAIAAMRGDERPLRALLDRITVHRGEPAPTGADLEEIRRLRSECFPQAPGSPPGPARGEQEGPAPRRGPGRGPDVER